MPILQIEHAVPDFAAWKNAFESDPIGRKQGGVRRYRILRPIDDPNYVIVDLEFDTSAKAEAFRSALGELWRGAGGRVAQGPRTRIIEAVEATEY
jgi:hypothetical protein